MLPDVTLPAPVVTFACVTAVMICVGVTPSAAICFGFSWMFELHLLHARERDRLHAVDGLQRRDHPRAE